MADSFPNHCVVCGTWITHPSSRLLYCSSRCKTADKCAATPRHDLLPAACSASGFASPYSIPSASASTSTVVSSFDRLGSHLSMNPAPPSGRSSASSSAVSLVLGTTKSTSHMVATPASPPMSAFSVSTVASESHGFLDQVDTRLGIHPHHRTEAAVYLGKFFKSTGQNAPYPPYGHHFLPTPATTSIPSVRSMSPSRVSVDHDQSVPVSPSGRSGMTGFGQRPSSPSRNPSAILPPRTNPLWTTDCGSTKSDMLVYPVPAVVRVPYSPTSPGALLPGMGSKSDISLVSLGSDALPREMLVPARAESAINISASMPARTRARLAAVQPDAFLDFPEPEQSKQKNADKLAIRMVEAEKPLRYKTLTASSFGWHLSPVSRSVGSVCSVGSTTTDPSMETIAYERRKVAGQAPVHAGGLRKLFESR